jgi:purine-binding chemotaxis protein CheW
MPPDLEQTRALLVSVDGRACALPLAHLIETMRWLPVEPMADGPDFVRGIAIIRGSGVPVVDLGTLLGTGGGEARARLLTVRTGEQCVALAVDRVLGFVDLATLSAQEMPPLLREAKPDLVRAIGVLDERLLVVLGAARLLPESTWAALEAAGPSA